MAEYIKNGGLPPLRQTLTSFRIIKKFFKMVDYLCLRQTLSSSHLGFRLTFLPIFAGLPTLPI